MANEYIGEGRYDHETKDCSVIAFAYSFNIPYQEAHKIFKEGGRKDNKGFHPTKILGREQLKMYMNRVVQFKATPHMTVKKFSEKNKQGIFYLVVRGHAFAVIDGKVLNEPRLGKRIKYYYKIGLPNGQHTVETKIDIKESVQQKQIITDIKIGDKVSFKPHKLNGDQSNIVGEVVDVFINKEGKEYCKIKFDRFYFKRLNSVTKL